MYICIVVVVVVVVVVEIMNRNSFTIIMAAKTSVFYLTERVTLSTAGTGVSDTIDLGSYVDIADRQGILVHEVDYSVQGTTATQGMGAALGGSAAVVFQLTDLNRGDMVFTDDRALISAGRFDYVTGGGYFNVADLYPDNFGPTSAQGGRIVINDQMYFRAESSAIASGESVNVTVRIKCSVVNLSQKDFMAIALQSTAADN